MPLYPTPQTQGRHKPPRSPSVIVLALLHPGRGHGVAQPSKPRLPQVKVVKYESNPRRFRLFLLLLHTCPCPLRFAPSHLFPRHSSSLKCSPCSLAHTRPLPDPQVSRHNHGARFARGSHASGAVRGDYCWWHSVQRGLDRHHQTGSRHGHRAKQRLTKSYGKTV